MVAKVEPSLADAAPGVPYQLERKGYFCVDPKDSRPGALVLNRTVTLRDTWAKIEKKQGGPAKPKANRGGGRRRRRRGKGDAEGEGAAS